jgi:hypothetical protein
MARVALPLLGIDHRWVWSTRGYTEALANKTAAFDTVFLRTDLGAIAVWAGLEGYTFGGGENLLVSGPTDGGKGSFGSLGHGSYRILTFDFGENTYGSSTAAI